MIITMVHQQTIDTPMPLGGEPQVWFHEIFRKDGAPYSQQEVALIESLTQKQ